MGAPHPVTSQTPLYGPIRAGRLTARPWVMQVYRRAQGEVRRSLPPSVRELTGGELASFSIARHASPAGPEIEERGCTLSRPSAPITSEDWRIILPGGEPPPPTSTKPIVQFS